MGHRPLTLLRFLDQLGNCDEEEISAFRPKQQSLRELFDAVHADAVRGARIRRRWNESLSHWSIIAGFEEYEAAWHSAATELAAPSSASQRRLFQAA